ncbi:MAG: class I SAM-dependent methyltransferase [Pseudomonadota bacterium]
MTGTDQNATAFGAQAANYASARPTYPAVLFDWIAGQLAHKRRVWDVATGSGQAALALTQHFDHVHASDIDADQLAVATAHPKITYHHGPAHQSGLASQSVDAITVATGLHWFEFDLFWPEVSRVAAPDALFAAWTYQLPVGDPDLNMYLLDPIMSVIDPYWSARNRQSWQGYNPSWTGMPFARVAVPAFSCALEWTPRQVLSFVKTWSAYIHAVDDGHRDRLAAIEETALATLCDTPSDLEMPLHLVAAKVVG